MPVNGYKSIGVFINKSDYYFESSVYHAVRNRAAVLGYHVFFFSTVGYRDSGNRYDKQEKSMFQFAPVKNMDGLLVAPENFEQAGFKSSLYKMLSRCSCPIVCLRSRHDTYDCVYNDEENAIRPLLAHLLDDHKLSDVCFQAGFKGHPDGEKRLQCYLEEMEKRNLPLPEGAVFYGTMWTSEADKAYQHYFTQRSHIPQAIVCANDYMAHALIKEVQLHGYRVPEDVIITGFDNMDSYSSPSLTTMGQDYITMAESAISLLDERIREREMGIVSPRKEIVIRSALIRGESCGCKKCSSDDLIRRLRDAGQMLNSIRSREVSQTYFSISMNACDTLKDIHTEMIKHIPDVPSIKDYYLCLFTDKSACDVQNYSFPGKITQTACLAMGVRNRKDLGMPMTAFDYQQLLPPVPHSGKEPQAYYVMLLHQRNKTYGYSLCQYDEDQYPTIYYHHWNVIMANALSNISIQDQMRALYDERRLSSITDSMTGLNNRRGLEEYIQPLWKKMCQQQEQTAFISFDMDNLKKINDTWGHASGDQAICLFANAISRALPYTGIAARTGGDEFIVCIQRCDAGMCDSFIDLVWRYIDQNCESDSIPFYVEAACGVYLTSLQPDSLFEECIKRSDEQLYIDKAQHRAQKKARQQDHV